MVSYRLPGEWANQVSTEGDTSMRTSPCLLQTSMQRVNLPPPTRDERLRSEYSPEQGPTHRFIRPGAIRLLYDSVPAFGVHPDEELRFACPRESGLHVDTPAVIQSFLMMAEVKRWVCPRPEFLTATSHIDLL